MAKQDSTSSGSSSVSSAAQVAQKPSGSPGASSWGTRGNQAGVVARSQVSQSAKSAGAGEPLRSGTIFGGSGSGMIPGAPSGTLSGATQPSRSSSSNARSLKSLEPFRLREDLSAHELQTFLTSAMSSINGKGELYSDQQIDVPLFGENQPRRFSTSGNIRYGETANDGSLELSQSSRVITQTELYSLIFDAAEQLQKRYPDLARNLKGFSREAALRDVGGGSEEALSLEALDSAKSRAELRDILLDAAGVAREAAKVETAPPEAAPAPAVPETTAESETDAPAEEDTFEFSPASSSESSEGSGGEGPDSDAQNQTEPETPAEEQPLEEQATDEQPEEQLPENQPQLKPIDEQPPEQQPDVTSPIVLETDVQLDTTAQTQPNETTTSTIPTTPSGSPPRLSQAGAEQADLVALLTQKFSHDYVGTYVSHSDIPPEFQQELATAIEQHLSTHYSSTDLEKLRFSPTLYRQAVQKLNQEFQASAISDKTRQLLEQYAAGNIPEARRQEILKALADKSYLTVSDSDNPYRAFVAKAESIVGQADTGALLTANLQAAESSLEASIIAIGGDRTRQLLENASPEQLRSLLNIPEYVTLSTDQLEELRFSVVALTPQLTARLVLDAEAPQIERGLFGERSQTPVPAGRAQTPFRSLSTAEQEDIENVEKLGKNAAKSLTQSSRGTKKKLDRIQQLLQGSWDSLDRDLQEYIYSENDVPLPANTHPEDRLPYTTAFIQYTQQDLDTLQRWLEKRGITDLATQQSALSTFQTSGEFLEAQRSVIEAEVVGKNLRQEYLSELGDAEYAVRAHAAGLIAADGTYGGELTLYLSPEEIALLSGELTPESDFSSYYELLQSGDALADTPELFQQYQQAYYGARGLPGGLGGQLGRFKSFSRARSASARAASLRKTAQRMQELQKIGVSAAQAIAGNPVAIAQLASMLLTTDTGRKILGAAAGLSLLPALPALGMMLGAANMWGKMASGVSNAFSGITGGGSSAAGSAGSTAGASSAQAAASAPIPPVSTAGSVGTGGAVSGTPASFSGVAVQTTGFNIFASFSGVVFSSSFGFVIFVIFMLFIVIQAAFLIPTPSLVPGRDPSLEPTENKYAILDKKVAPSKLPNNTLQEVAYTVQFAPKLGYVLEITEVTDEYSFLGDGDSSFIDGTNPSYPKIVSPLTTETFGTEKLESMITRRYAQQLQAVDTLVINTAKITFNVYDDNGTLLRSGETLTNSASVRIGNPKTACWPTSGTITQGPKSGNSTHKYTESFDIGAPIGTKIYAPFSGTACSMSYTFASGYGYNVTLKIDFNGIPLTFVFAHMNEPTWPAGYCQDVTEGEEIGVVGTTGNSTGPHLHYELRRENLPAGLSIRNFILEGPTARVGNEVQSCFAL